MATPKKIRKNAPLDRTPSPPRHERATMSFSLAAATVGSRKAPTPVTFSAPAAAINVLAVEPARVKPLLERYGVAMAQSRRSGHAVSFRVDVAPDGQATVRPVEDRAAGQALALEGGQRDPALERALEEARERGRLRSADILSAADMLSADAFATLLGTTRASINTWRQNAQVLGLEGAKRGYRFPSWQIDRDGKPYAELARLAGVLGSPWAVYRFLTEPHGALNGMTALAALENGQGAQVLDAANGVARGDFY